MGVEQRLKFRQGVPPAPAYLSEEAQAEYDRVVSEIETTNSEVLQQVDWMLVAQYAHAFQKYSQACDEMQGTDLYLQGPNGGLYMHPLHNVVSMYRKAMNEAMGKLGFSPSDRMKIEGYGAKKSRIKEMLGGR